MEVVDALLGFGGHGPLDPSHVCIHETAGPGAPAVNLVSWWRGGGGLPVHYVGDWTGKAYYCVPEDEVCWQVGNGNPHVVGIELCHAANRADFEAVWRLGVEWAAWQLSKRGWGVDRLISHRQAAERWGGSDHTDPDGYFEEFGRSWDGFVADVEKELRKQGEKEAQMPTKINSPAKAKTVYRVYNRATGEHFYPSGKSERDALVKAGWKDEGVAFELPANGSVPVYRLSQPGGKHLFTADYDEACGLAKAGWSDEGVRFWGQASGRAVYRLHNAANGDHLLTVDGAERGRLVKAGWKDEGVAFNAA